MIEVNSASDQNWLVISRNLVDNWDLNCAKVVCEYAIGLPHYQRRFAIDSSIGCMSGSLCIC